MTSHINRRQFAAAAAATSAALAYANLAGADENFKHPLHKAVFGSAGEGFWKGAGATSFADFCKKVKAAGFEGIESLDWNVSPETAKEHRKVVEDAGLKVHSVLRGWLEFNSDNPAQVANSISSAEIALRAAAGYGASAVLLVPCRLASNVTSPQAWEFDIKFDDKTGKVTQLVKGDSSKFADYIAAQDKATESSRAALRKLIPVAEAAGVLVGVENVWNGLWVRPDFFKHFVVSCDSPWIRAYYDIGNHVKYLIPPEEWIRTLGKLIIKLHIKDYKLSPDGHDGSWPTLHEGSVNWPAVRKALDEVGYDGWGTIESPGPISLEEQNRRFDLIIAGK